MSQADRRIEALEKEVRWLRRQLANVPIRVTPGGGGGGVGDSLGFYTAPTKAQLPNATPPAIGYTQDNYRYYWRMGSSWVCGTHLE
jgi:hypothetical protein